LRDFTSAPRAFYGQVDATSVLRLTGPIRYVAAQALRQRVDELFRADARAGVLVDLSAVDAIDSTAMGLLARIGRASLRRSARRAVLACPENDVAATLRAAAFDELFVMLEQYPFDESATTLAELPLDRTSAPSLELGRIVLDAHRDLASVSARNVEAYRDVIAALEADLRVAGEAGEAGTGGA